jgi:lysophospholipase L1-like esterase
VKRDAPPRVLDGWMLQNAGPAGIVDLRAVGYQQVDFVLADDEGHLSAKGNQLTGEALASRLRQIAGSCAAAL